MKDVDDNTALNNFKYTIENCSPERGIASPLNDSGVKLLGEVRGKNVFMVHCDDGIPSDILQAKVGEAAENIHVRLEIDWILVSVYIIDTVTINLSLH